MTARCNAVDAADPARVRGWCPRGSRVMWAEDGALIRLRFAGNQPSGRDLAALAPLAARYAAGGATLTRRAKLELRGVAHPQAALAALRDAGLLESGGAADLPDIVVCDTPGHHRPARRLARALRARLAVMPGIDNLPDKFLMAIVGDEVGAARDLRCDLQLTARPEGWQLTAGDAIAEQLTAEAALSQVVEHVEACLSLALPARIATDHRRPEAGSPARAAETVGFVFGVISAEALAVLGEIAQAGPIGLSPDRRLLIPELSAAERARLVALGALDGADDVRAGLTACVGQRGCAQATTDTRADALALAADRPDVARAGLHVSGCAKGCAARTHRAVTLVGRDGRYDLVEQGAPSDTPVLRGAAMQEIRAWLSARMARNTARL